MLEDEPLFLRLLSEALATGLTDVEVVATCSTAADFSGLDEESIDVLVTDLHLGAGEDGLELALQMRTRRPDVGVVILSNVAMPSLFASLPGDQLSGWAYLLKTSVANIDQLGAAIRVAHSGGMLIDRALTRSMGPRSGTPLAGLTDRQVQVLTGMANGWSNRHIAESLGLSVRSVESVVSSLMGALGVVADDNTNARVTAVLAYLRYSVDRSNSSLAAQYTK